MKDLGLFGSAKGEIIQYIETPFRGTKLDFENQIRGLPIFYLKSSLVSTVQSLPEGLPLIVSTDADSGPGSLRQAINAANRADGYQAIKIETSEPIRLLSRLPVISGPIDMIVSPDLGQAVIDFNGFAGLRFSKKASGSSLAALQISNSNGYGIQSDTKSLQLTNLQFGDSNGGSRSLNQKGSIKNPLKISGVNLQGWNNGQAALDRSFKIDDRKIQIIANNTLVSTTRVDSEPEKVRFYFDNKLDNSNNAMPTTFSPAETGSLAGSVIEKSLAKGELTKSAKNSLSKRFGDNLVQRLDSGNWLPTATLEDGTSLTLSWLQQSGNAMIGEFRLSMEETTKKPQLNALLGKTYQFTWTLPSPGTHTRSQRGEMAVKTLRATSQPIAIGFYEVDDPLTGMLGGLKPDEPGYEQAALSKATQSNLMLTDQITGHALNKSKTTRLEQMNPSRSYGMVVTGLKETNQIFTSYSTPRDGMLYPFQSFLLSHNRIAIGVEAEPLGTRADYTDLLLTMPDNISMLNAGWG